MKKYESDLNQLEVHSVAHPVGSARLNIQFILLLLTLGVVLEVCFVLLSIINVLCALKICWLYRGFKSCYRSSWRNSLAS